MITAEMSDDDILNLVNPCRCSGCSHGCNFGSGFLVPEDIPRLAEFLKMSEEKLKEEHLDEVEKFNTKLFRPKLEKYPYGRCTFYDQSKGCTVHDAKPMECKISMGCKDYGEELSIWFMLKNFVNKSDPESLRQFATYLESGGKTIPGGELKDLQGRMDLKRRMKECN